MSKKDDERMEDFISEEDHQVLQEKVVPITIPTSTHPLAVALCSRDKGRIESVLSQLKDDQIVHFVETEQTWPLQPLANAVGADSIVGIKKLLAAGAKVDEKSGKIEWQPLHFVSSVEALNVLLNAGGDVDALNESGVAVLTSACSRGHLDVVKKLLDKGANPNPIGEGAAAWTPALAAAGLSSSECLSLLVKKGADIKHKTSNGMTALHQAARKDSLPCAAFLIEMGVDVNVKGPSGMTPLHLAVKEGAKEVTMLLLSNAADPLLKDESGMVAADYAQKGFPIDLPKPEPKKKEAKTTKVKASTEKKETVPKKTANQKKDAGKKTSAKPSKSDGDKAAAKKKPKLK